MHLKKLWKKGKWILVAYLASKVLILAGGATLLLDADSCVFREAGAGEGGAGSGGKEAGSVANVAEAVSDEVNINAEGQRVVDDKAKLAELKDKLSEEQKYVCFEKGTEPAFSGKYYDNHEAGEYRCAVCAKPLFKSETKFDSGTGWPSFWDEASEGAVAQQDDHSHGMYRVEVTCANCGSHLGHIFPDGPKPTGLRYCINSLSLEFVPEEALKQEQDAENAVEESQKPPAMPAGH